MGMRLHYAFSDPLTHAFWASLVASVWLIFIQLYGLPCVLALGAFFFFTYLSQPLALQVWFVVFSLMSGVGGEILWLSCLLPLPNQRGLSSVVDQLWLVPKELAPPGFGLNR